MTERAKSTSGTEYRVVEKTINKDPFDDEETIEIPDNAIGLTVDGEFGSGRSISEVTIRYLVPGTEHGGNQ